MDNRPVVDKWKRLHDLGFVWGAPKPPEMPHPKDPFPPIVRPEPPSMSCWIKHKSWKCRLVVKQYLKPGMSKEELHDMWFETFDRFLEMRDKDAFQAAEFMMQSYGKWEKPQGGHDA